MPLTNPWLGGPTPIAELPRERLEERILNLLSTQNVAVIATILTQTATGRRFAGSQITSNTAGASTIPPADPLTIITPSRIVYTEHWLRRDGYNPRQIWRSGSE